MTISRRKLMISGAAASAAATGGVFSARLAGAAEEPAAAAKPGAAPAASPVGDVVGKVTVGYQGWFACPGDGAPINGWWHWSRDMSRPPSPDNTTIASWPDMREYDHT